MASFVLCFCFVLISSNQWEKTKITPTLVNKLTLKVVQNNTLACVQWNSILDDNLYKQFSIA